MKSFKFAILVILITFVSSCKDDNNSACSQAAWIGTYTGSQSCDGTIEDVIVTITASDDVENAVNIKYESNGSALTIFDLERDECNIYSESAFAIDISLDGDDLTYITTYPSTSSLSVCTIIATRDQ